jgi:hypothetical protein
MPFKDMNEFNALQAKIWAAAVHGEKAADNDGSSNGQQMENSGDDFKQAKIGGFLLAKIQVDFGFFF